MRALGEDVADALGMVTWVEGEAGDEGAAVVWCGRLVEGCSGTMAWSMVVHEVGAGLRPAVSSLASVNHLNGFDCPRSEE